MPELGYNPSDEQLTAAGYVRRRNPDGTYGWYRTKPGVAADAKGRTYPVPVRAAAKSFGEWMAAPRLRPATRLAPVGETEGGDCADGSCDTPSEVPSTPPPTRPPASSSTSSQKGPKGDKGDPGEPGPPGPKGDKGDPGEVDYDRLQGMIASVVGESLKQMQPQIEANISANLEVKITDSLLGKMAEDDRFKPATPDKIAQQMITLIQQNPELQELLRGPPGKDGKDGSDGSPATYEPPSNGAEWSHLVLIMPKDAAYYKRMEGWVRQAQDHYNGLRVVEPPTDRDIGELPVLVAYQGGSPAKMFKGTRKVEAALAAITRGEFDAFLFPKGETDGT